MRDRFGAAAAYHFAEPAFDGAVAAAVVRGVVVGVVFDDRRAVEVVVVRTAVAANATGAVFAVVGVVVVV